MKAFSDNSSNQFPAMALTTKSAGGRTRPQRALSMKPITDSNAEADVDPKKLFSDERFNGYCVYCGGNDATGDHVPSKVLLDKPFPSDLPKVAACADCNLSFSSDEPYLACLIDCVIAGSVNPIKVGREKVQGRIQIHPIVVSA